MDIVNAECVRVLPAVALGRRARRHQALVLTVGRRPGLWAIFRGLAASDRSV
jgi:hypothetical protein